MAFMIIFLIMVLLLLVFAGVRLASRLTHAGGIVYRKYNGRILYLIVSSSSIKHKWVLPKGHIEKNEKAKYTAVREVLEESGVLAKPIKKAGITRYRKKGRRLACIYFVMEFVEARGESPENRKVLWVEKEEALERLGGGRMGRVLEKVVV